MSGVGKRVWLAFAAATLVDIVVAYILSHYVNHSTDDPWSGFLIILALLWGGMAALGIYAFAKSMVLYFVLRNEAGAFAAARSLRDAGLPRPDEFERSYLLYLDEVIADERLDPSVRIKASYFKGEHDGFVATPGFAKNIQFDLSCDRAIEIYRDKREK